jgi:hypothetical protein
MTAIGTMVDIIDPLAVAVAAAVELAKTGGAYLYKSTARPTQIVKTDPEAEAAPSCHSPQTVVSLSPSLSHGEEEASDRSDPNSTSEEEEEEEEEEGAERRLARGRERNREHARRTRLRKKAQLEALQSKVKGLQADSRVLQQSLEECSLANILVGLSSSTNNNNSNNKDASTSIPSLLQVAQEQAPNDSNSKSNSNVGGTAGGYTNKRRRFVSDASDTIPTPPQPLKLKINGRSAVIGGGGSGTRTHINWKTGVYSDESGTKQQLTQAQLERLRYVPLQKVRFGLCL